MTGLGCKSLCHNIEHNEECYQNGMRDERAKIVAWLRREHDERMASKIEDGDHND